MFVHVFSFDLTFSGHSRSCGRSGSNSICWCRTGSFPAGFPGGSVSKSLANLLRPRDALWYGMLGRPFGGKIAAQIGLINKSVPAAELLNETMTVARELAQKDPWALKATKESLKILEQK